MNEQTIFLNALEKAEASQRLAYLDQVCGGDVVLRQKVEALLREHEHSSVSLANADADLSPTLDVKPLKNAGKRQRIDCLSTPENTFSAGPPSGLPSADLPNICAYLASPRQPDSLGRLDHYEMLKVLGKGGFGTVFKAFDETLHRVVAVKVLAPELAVTTAARARFLREARAAAAVRHDHVINIHAVGDHPLPHLVMEYIDGQTLQEKLNETGPLPLKDILRIGYQIACGLAAAHSQGLIHRDIKPVNILLEKSSDRVKITDFGLARTVDDASLSQAGVVLGTPQFMSPEQAQGKTLDPRSDLFNLGSTLYVMCTGQLPFRASGSLAVLKRVVDDEPTSVRDLNPQVPAWLAAIVARLHAKKPEDRFQSAQELADLLAQLQMHGEVRTPSPHEQTPARLPLEPTSATTQSFVPESSRRFVITMVVAILLLSGLGVFWATHSPQKNNHHHPDLKGPLPIVPVVQPELAKVPFDDKQAAAFQEAWAKHLGVPVEIENSLGMKFRLIPPGEFAMGSSPQDIEQMAKTKFTGWAGWSKYAGPVHQVAVKEPFYLGTCEVTLAQFRQFAEALAYQTLAETDGLGGSHWIKGKTLRRPEWNWRSTAFHQTDQHPAVHIAWDDARAFCDWLNAKEGRLYVLPSEAQWEFACRAGNPGSWCFGNDGALLSQYGWVRTLKSTELVGSKKANPFGLWDMHGNALDWCSDSWVPYRAEPDRECPDHPADPTFFVQRGGSFVMNEVTSQSAFRIGQPKASNGSAEGFRVAIVNLR
jgi:serine/threonine protein kinase